MTMTTNAIECCFWMVFSHAYQTYLIFTIIYEIENNIVTIL